MQVADEVLTRKKGYVMGGEGRGGANVSLHVSSSPLQAVACGRHHRRCVHPIASPRPRPSPTLSPSPPSCNAGHVKEVLLAVHAAVEQGDDDAADLAGRVLDGLFRDYDVPGELL